MKTFKALLNLLSVALIASTMLMSCSKKSGDGDQASGEKSAEKQTLWVYTSLYKDTINRLKPMLAQDFPNVEFKWFQAGSEDIATKVNAEILSGRVQADVMISSDRFWYEELAQSGYLEKYNAPEEIDAQLKNPDGLYSVLSLPVMVLCYNQDLLKNGHPKSYKDLADPKWKSKVTTGSPLASGTNFTTMAMLQHHYGWEYFEGLKNNETIAQGGNSSVLRRIQSGERPVGWVLMENVLRLIDQDKRLKMVFPSDGSVTHANVLAIAKKKNNRELAKKFAAWMFGPKGQAEMTRSYMYSPLPNFEAPKGAPPLAEILKNSFPWTKEFLQSVTEKRVALKEKYTDIMFQ